jgi:hypothetical protein
MTDDGENHQQLARVQISLPDQTTRGTTKKKKIGGLFKIDLIYKQCRNKSISTRFLRFLFSLSVNLYQYATKSSRDVRTLGFGQQLAGVSSLGSLPFATWLVVSFPLIQASGH